MIDNTTYKELQGKVKKLSNKVSILEHSKKEAQETADKYWKMFQHFGAAVVVFDTDGIILTLNNVAAAKIGGDRASFIGKTVHELYPEKAWAYIDRLRQVYLSGEEHHFEDLLQLNGTKTWFRSTLCPAKSNDGMTFAVQGIFLDITESKVAETELKNNEEKYRKLFELSNDGIVIHSIEGEVLEANNRMLEIAGYRKGTFDKDSLEGFNYGKDKGYIKGIFEKLSMENSVHFISDYRRPDGKIVTVDTRISIVDKEKGLAQSVVKDITDQNKTKGLLHARERELKRQTDSLEETNAALKVILAERERDKKVMEESLLSNVKDMVLPYVEKLESSRLNDLQRLYVRMIKNNIGDITNPFLNDLSSKYTKLTPMEIRVARFVKDGKTTKEIAELLSSTIGTIEFHRNNIRKKLGLRNSGTNLRVYLMSIK